MSYSGLSEYILLQKGDNVRAHEKMLLNSKLMQAVPYTRHDGVGRGCALGMMEGPEITRIVGYHDHSAEVLYPWLKNETTAPCTCRLGLSPQVRCVIAHLFNEHVCGGGNFGPNPDVEPWTMERLADYIKSIDPTVDPDEELICEQETSHDQAEVKA